MKINAQNLDAVHRYITDTVQQWASGLITDREFSLELARVSETFEARADELSGLHDPNTWMQY